MCDYDGYNEFDRTADVLTRKPHRCEECHQHLPAGSRAIYVAGKYEGEIFSYHLCLVCSAMMTADEDSEFHACPGDISRHDAKWLEMECAIEQVREPSERRLAIYEETADV